MKTGMKTLCLAIVLSLGCISNVQAAASESKPVAGKPVAENKVEKKSDIAVSSEETISINTGSAEALAQVMNGVGLKKAQAIVSYREQYGPFKSLDQLKEVPGMGGALVERNLSRLKL